MKSIYTLAAVENLINRYIERGGNMAEAEPGVLGYGVVVLFGEGLKTIVIKEVYLNEWSSGHTITKYNECPKKYEKYIY